MRSVAILSRLIAMLALALFALPHGLADRSVAQAGSSAESRVVDPCDGILTVQRQLLRAQLPGDDTTDLTEQVAAVPAPPAPVALRFTVSENASLVHSALRFLPPVRGPPAV